MSDYGLESPLWLGRQIVKIAPPPLLRKAVLDVIEHLVDKADNGGRTSPFEVIDRLIQVSSTGEYREPQPQEETVYRRVINVGDGTDIEEIMREVEGFLGTVPETENPDGDFDLEEFHRSLGIPPEEEEDDEE